MPETKSCGLSEKDNILIHVKVIGGNPYTIEHVRNSLNEFAKTVPYKLNAIITNGYIEIENVGELINQLKELQNKSNTTVL